MMSVCSKILVAHLPITTALDNTSLFQNLEVQYYQLRSLFRQVHATFYQFVNISLPLESRKHRCKCEFLHAARVC